MRLGREKAERAVVIVILGMELEVSRSERFRQSVQDGARFFAGVNVLKISRSCGTSVVRKRRAVTLMTW